MTALEETENKYLTADILSTKKSSSKVSGISMIFFVNIAVKLLHNLDKHART